MSQLVYSTDTGRISTPQKSKKQVPQGDGVVRITRQTAGRKGAGVSLITGLNLTERDLKSLAKAIKQRLGCGGSVKNGVIELQSDNRPLIQELLAKQGISSKIAGG